MLSRMFCMLYTTTLPKKKLSPNNTTPNSNSGIKLISNIVISFTYSFTVLKMFSILIFHVILIYSIVAISSSGSSIIIIIWGFRNFLLSRSIWELLNGEYISK